MFSFCVFFLPVSPFVIKQKPVPLYSVRLRTIVLQFASRATIFKLRLYN